MRKLLTNSGFENSQRIHAELERLYLVEYDKMVRLAYTLLRSNARAEEIVQDAFVELAPQMNRLRRPGGYLRSVVVSRCYSDMRRTQVGDNKLRAVASTPAESVADRSVEFRDLLADLPAEQQMVIVLKFYGGYRASEIATWLGLRPSTVRSQLRRGLAALRKELTSE